MSKEGFKYTHSWAIPHSVTYPSRSPTRGVPLGRTHPSNPESKPDTVIFWWVWFHLLQNLHADRSGKWRYTPVCRNTFHVLALSVKKSKTLCPVRTQSPSDAISFIPKHWFLWTWNCCWDDNIFSWVVVLTGENVKLTSLSPTLEYLISHVLLLSPFLLSTTGHSEIMNLIQWVYCPRLTLPGQTWFWT